MSSKAARQRQIQGLKNRVEAKEQRVQDLLDEVAALRQQARNYLVENRGGKN